MPRTDFTNVAFSVDDGNLIMDAQARAGHPYRHTCPLESLTAIAHAIEAAGKGGVSREDLHERTGIAWTRINVALVFLDERSIVERAGKRGRLVVLASRTLVEDALVEYHALREGEAATQG